MFTQSIFQAGNSQVIAIPKHLLKELNLKLGQKVLVEKIDDDTLVVKKTTTKTKKSTSSIEFKKWLDKVLEEDAETLDELANR